MQEQHHSAVTLNLEKTLLYSQEKKPLSISFNKDAHTSCVHAHAHALALILSGPKLLISRRASARARFFFALRRCSLFLRPRADNRNV